MKEIFALEAFDEKSGELNVIIETPKGSRNKFSFSEKLGLFKLKSVLPAGAIFPYDFGFIPSTKGEDGDPLDVLLLMDEPAFPGCLVPSRLIGVIEAEQKEKNGDIVRNDRFIAVSADTHTHDEIHELRDLSKTVLDEIEHFFVSYNIFKGKEFFPLHRSGAKRAAELVRVGERKFRQEKKEN